MNFLQRHKMLIFSVLVSLLGFSLPFLYQSIPEMGWSEVNATIFFLFLSLNL